MRFPRSSGILLHPSSFPGRYGIGDFGDAAFEFVDFLVQAGQSWWQILPLGPTGYGDSPYQSFSSFAGNVLLINPDYLVRDGFLPAAAVQDVPHFPPKMVDFGWVIDYKTKLLAQAHEHFKEKGTAVQHAALDQFCQEQASWLDDYALFMALKAHHVEHEGGVWNTWPTDIAQRKPKEIKAWREKLADDVARHKFLQFVFWQQWTAVKTYANEHGIKIVGDMPIFVAFDSADVWANPDKFYLDETGAATVIAGVPPDYFSATGQRWGNPLYRWDKMKENGYAWWVARLQMAFTQADIVRIDHFRGFEAYWEIPADEPTAVVGQWVKGPYMDFFDAMREQLGDLPLIAEDLGVITPEVEALRDRYDFPGMKILQFAFGGERNSTFLPHTYEHNCVVYTGTHDNETIVGWYQNADESERDHIRRYLGVSGQDIAWDMIRLAMMSVGDTAVIPLQDMLNLDNSARMNFPGKVGGYWGWRYPRGVLTDALAYRMRELAFLYGRLPEEPAPAAE
jgi:4-alpha-glucanotransferase